MGYIVVSLAGDPGAHTGDGATAAALFHLSTLPIFRQPQQGATSTGRGGPPFQPASRCSGIGGGECGCTMLSYMLERSGQFLQHNCTVVIGVAVTEISKGLGVFGRGTVAGQHAGATLTSPNLQQRSRQVSPFRGHLGMVRGCCCSVGEGGTVMCSFA